MTATKLSFEQKLKSKKFAKLKKSVTIFFFMLVPILLFFLIKNVDWQEVKQAVQEIKPTTLGLGLFVSLMSFLVYGCYDLLGRRYSGHSLPIYQILPVAFVCYAFTLNLSSLVGGFALRFRLYSRLGLTASTITKIFTLSLMTNWLGYMALAGIIFSCRLLDLPDNWKIGTTGLQVIGFILLSVASIYLLACQFSKRRSWKFFGHKIYLPNIGFALLQIMLACLNWSLMALVIWIFLPAKITYVMTLGIFLLCAMAGTIARVPGGLGVLEGIFVVMLQHQLSKGTILAALIGYRVCYFLVPLCIAVVTYFIIEGRAKKLRMTNSSAAASQVKG